MTKKEKSEATEKKKIVKRRTTRRKKEVKTKKTKSKSNTSSESKTLDSKKSTLESKTRKSKFSSKSGVTTSSIKSTDSTKKRRSRTTIEEVSSKRAESKKTKTIKSKKTKNVESKKIKKIESNNIDSKIKFKHIDIDKVDADLVGRVYNIDDSPLGGIYQNKKKFQFITSTGQMLESSVLEELISQLKPLKWCRIKWRQNKRFNVCDHTKESTMKPSVYVNTEWVSEVRDSLKA